MMERKCDQGQGGPVGDSTAVVMHPHCTAALCYTILYRTRLDGLGGLYND